MIADHVATQRLVPLADHLRLTLSEAIGTHPTTCYARDRDLSLTVTPLDAKRVVVLGERILVDFAPLCGRDAAGTPLYAWHVSIARYYDRAWVAADFHHAAETILEDFARAVFEREAYQHQTLR